MYESSGAVVISANLVDPTVLLLRQIRRNGQEQVVSPKGRIEHRESPLAAAFREVREETGISTLAFAGFLGRQRFRFQDDDGVPATKVVHWFLLTTAEQSVEQRKEEGFVEAGWYSLYESLGQISHRGFQPYLEQAIEIVRWRQLGELSFSELLARVVNFLLVETSWISSSVPAAGLAICGSAARGDFVDGWSDVDLVGWGLAIPSSAADKLAEIMARSTAKFGIHTSLHIIDEDGCDASGAGVLYDMKLRAMVERADSELAVISGVTRPDLPRASGSGSAHGIGNFLAFARTRLASQAASESERKDRARRVLSVVCSAGRRVSAVLDPEASSRLSAVVSTLERHYGPLPITHLLRQYDEFRRSGAPSMATAEELAAQAPYALEQLQGIWEE
jgi:ADP-ribose pyrophosphatase YjhB (NUDIX family)